MRPDIPFRFNATEDVADTVIFLVTQPTRVVIDKWLCVGLQTNYEINCF